MKPKYKILKNGLRVVVVHTPHLSKSSITLVLNGGPVHEDNNNKGIFHLCEHAIFLGSKKYPSSVETDAQFIKNGIFYNASTFQEGVDFNMQFHKTTFKKSVRLLYEIIANPIFKSGDIRAEKKRIAEEMRVSKNSNYEIFDDVVNEFMYSGIALFRDPLVGFNEIAREEIILHYNKFYIPNNMVISYVGPEKAENVFNIIEKTFGTLKKGGDIVYPKMKINLKKKLGKRKKITNKIKDFKYFSFIAPILYTKTNNKDMVFLLKKVLDKKINDRLIVDEKIAYSVDVFLTDLGKIAVLEISSSFSKNPNKFIDKIESIFSDFKITEKELNNIKKTIFQQMDYTKDSTTTYADYLAYNYLDDPVRDLDGEKRALKKITARQINNFAKRILKKENYSIFIADN